MAAMTPRERVLTALNRQEPDRVPTALWGGPYGLVDEVYLALLELLNLGEPVPPFRSGHNISYIDDRLLDELGTDTRYVWPGDSPSSPHFPAGKLGALVDGYGQPWIRALPYYYPGKGILAKATVDDIDRLVDWPDAGDPRWTAGVRRRARSLKSETDYFVVGRMVTSHGPFQTASNLRGAEQFLMDLALNEAFAEALIARVTDTIAALLENYMRAGGDYFDMVELPGDDFATATSTIISPAMFRRFFKPALQQLVATVKSYRNDVKIMFHSDGMIQSLIPELIEIGVDAIHPLEPLPTMDLAKVKAAYADRLAFIGGIDIVQAMTGSEEDVVAEARRRIQQLGPGGGYILAPANHIQPDVPPENVVALYRAARAYGSYSS